MSNVSEEIQVKNNYSTQKLKLLGEVPRYDLYYFLTHILK
jgi:hypothetical protein